MTLWMNWREMHGEVGALWALSMLLFTNKKVLSLISICFHFCDTVMGFPFSLSLTLCYTIIVFPLIGGLELNWVWKFLPSLLVSSLMSW